MNIQQIAELLGYSERTIRRKLAGTKYGVRIAESQGRGPAAFERDEVVEIARICGRGAVADLLDQTGKMPVQSGILPVSQADVIASAVVHALRQSGVLRMPASAARRLFAEEIRSRAKKLRQPEQSLYLRAYRELEAATGVNLDALRSAGGFATIVEAADYYGYCERLCSIAQEWVRAEFKQQLLSIAGGKEAET